MIHLDMKGAPPKFEFLERLLKFISAHFKHLVNGVIIEFEDMFPFTGFLSQINSPNCYSKEQIQQLGSLCKNLGLKFSVLIQTFGHMEYVLKHSRFENYRE
jgi:hexosaminidase